MNEPRQMIPESDAHLFAWERSLWHAALVCGAGLSAVARGLAVDMLEMTAPRLFHHCGALGVFGDLVELAQRANLPHSVCAAAIDELRKSQVLIRRLQGWEFDLAYLDNQQATVLKPRRPVQHRKQATRARSTAIEKE